MSFLPKSFTKIRGLDNESVEREVEVSRDGYLKTADMMNDIMIASGQVPNVEIWNQSGTARDFDGADGYVDAWLGSQSGASYEQYVYQYSTTADIDTMSSDNAADVGQVVVILGLDGTYAKVTQTAVLNGQNKVTLTTPLLRIYFARVVVGAALTGNVFIYPDTTLTAGKPTSNALIRCIMTPVYNMSSQFTYTIPLGYTGYVYGGGAISANESNSTSYIVTFETRTAISPWGTTLEFPVNDSASSSVVRDLLAGPIALPEKTDIRSRVRFFTATGTAGYVSSVLHLKLIKNPV